VLPRPLAGVGWRHRAGLPPFGGPNQQCEKPGHNSDGLPGRMQQVSKRCFYAVQSFKFWLVHRLRRPCHLQKLVRRSKK
jgi:hypothetical protein